MNFSVFQRFPFSEIFMDKNRGVTILRWVFFVSQCRNISLRIPSLFQKTSGSEKRFQLERLSRFCRKLSVWECRNFSLKNPSVFQKVFVIVTFWIKTGVSRFCVEYFLSHSAETIRWGYLLCFRKLPVLKIFSRREGITILSKTFCLTVLKLFVEHFSVPEI